MVLEKSPVSPSMWPVAMADAFAVVNVGNSAWLLRRLTPSRAIAAMVGAVVSSTERKRKPSATNRTTLCGRDAGVCAKAADTSKVVRMAAAKRSGKRMYDSRATGQRRLVPTPDDDGVTGVKLYENQLPTELMAAKLQPARLVSKRRSRAKNFASGF